jgi:hypothetical protein
MSNHGSDRYTLRARLNVASKEVIVTAMPVSPGKKPLYARYPANGGPISSLLPAQLLNAGGVADLVGLYQPYAFEKSRLEAWGLAEAD